MRLMIVSLDGFEFQLFPGSIFFIYKFRCHIEFYINDFCPGAPYLWFLLRRRIYCIYFVLAGCSASRSIHLVFRTGASKMKDVTNDYFIYLFYDRAFS
jgi:hypothetical protein